MSEVRGCSNSPSGRGATLSIHGPAVYRAMQTLGATRRPDGRLVVEHNPANSRCAATGLSAMCSAARSARSSAAFAKSWGSGRALRLRVGIKLGDFAQYQGGVDESHLAIVI